MKQRSPPQLHLKRLPRLTKGERIEVFGLEQNGQWSWRDQRYLELEDKREFWLEMGTMRMIREGAFSDDHLMPSHMDKRDRVQHVALKRPT